MKSNVHQPPVDVLHSSSPSSFPGQAQAVTLTIILKAAVSYAQPKLRENFETTRPGSARCIRGVDVSVREGSILSVIIPPAGEASDVKVKGTRVQGCHGRFGHSELTGAIETCYSYYVLANSYTLRAIFHYAQCARATNPNIRRLPVYVYAANPFSVGLL